MNKRISWILCAAIVVLYVLHNDFWFWDDPRIVLGLPVGLTYHIGYNLAAAVLMFLLVRFAWPSHLEVAGETAGENSVGRADGDAAQGGSSREEAAGGER